MTPVQIASQVLLTRRKARNSFLEFRKLIHKRLLIGWWQEEISQELENFYYNWKDGLRPKLIITCPPQHGKSTIVNDLLLWAIGKESESENDIKLIYASFSDSLAVRANRRIQRITSTSNYKAIFPKFAPTSKTQDLILFGDDSYFRNTTIGGAITGEQMDWGVIDDFTKGRAEANSETIRNKIWDWFTSDFSTRYSEKSAFLCICTRWHVSDMIGTLLEVDPTVKILKYPAIAEMDEAHRAQGEPLFPEHKSLEFLSGIKAIIPSYGWNSLYQCNPTLAEGNFFKPDFIQVVDALPAGLEFVRAWDLAATANGGDYTAGGKVAYDKFNQVAYIADYVRGQWGPDDVEKILKSTAQSDGVRCKIRLPQDPGQAGKAQIRNLVKLLAGFSVIAETVSGDKETRASPVAAQVNIGNVYMLRGSWNRAFIEELRLFPNGVNDDQVDALSDGYNHFTIKKIGSF